MRDWKPIDLALVYEMFSDYIDPADGFFVSNKMLGEHEVQFATFDNITEDNQICPIRYEKIANFI